MPSFPGWWAALGPGIVWLALAQGSGELIWWPYLVAKYGLGFMCLLIPACLLQLPVNYHIGYYTMATGESIFQGFMRWNRWYALLLWGLMTVAFAWFGAFASAGGTSLAALTDFPQGWSVRGQTLFWAYGTMGAFLLALLFMRVVYEGIEKLMWLVAIVTVVGLMWACLDSAVLAVLPEFVRGLFIPIWPEGKAWDPADTTKLLTALTFAGLGGFWALFYSYWLREKGAGMASHVGRMTSPITGHLENVPDAGFEPEDDKQLEQEWPKWRRFLVTDSSIGVGGNLLTTLMTCLLAYALLFPQGLLPEGYDLAVVQGEYFGLRWGPLGTALFLLVAAAFLSDTWLATVDAVSRINTDILLNFFPKARKKPARWWYYFWIVWLAGVTGVTVLLDKPGPLILLSAVIGFLGTVLFMAALIGVCYRLIPRLLPKPLHLGSFGLACLTFSYLIYIGLAGAYVWVKFF